MRARWPAHRPGRRRCAAERRKAASRRATAARAAAAARSAKSARTGYACRSGKPAAAPPAAPGKSRRLQRRNGKAAAASSPRRSRGGLREEAGSTSRRVTGSGPHGRIVKRDIETPRRRRRRQGAPAAAAGGRRRAMRRRRHVGRSRSGSSSSRGSYELVPHDSMRKIIARRLVEAKKTIPHFYLTMDCRIDKLLALRAEINAAAPMTRRQGQGRPASSRSTTWSSRRWRWR